MITYFLILAFISIFYALTAPFLLLPDATLNTNITNTFIDLKNYLGYINLIAPINDLIKVIIFILGFEASVLVFRLIKTIIRG